VPEHTVRNFAYRKSNRPKNAFLGKLYRHFSRRPDLLPEDLAPVAAGLRVHAPREPLGRIAQYDLIRLELPISADDLRRVYDRYNGYYLCFRRSHHAERMSVAWLHLRPLSPTVDISREGLPLPRFTLFIKYADPFDPELVRSHIIMGYTISRNGRLFFVGHHDGELQYLVLNEPTIRPFTYLQGLCLLTAADDKQPFSTRIVCQRLASDARRPAWEEHIGVFAEADFAGRFANAEIIVRARGEAPPILG
jgi:hypothetical protein